MEQLTDRQTQVLKEINKFIKIKGFSPTNRELAKVFGISVKGLHDHLTALRRKGYIDWEDGNFRTIKILKEI